MHFVTAPQLSYEEALKLLQQYEANHEFQDFDFPTDAKSLCFGIKTWKNNIKEQIIWKRLKEIHQGKQELYRSPLNPLSIK